MLRRPALSLLRGKPLAESSAPGIIPACRDACAAVTKATTKRSATCSTAAMTVRSTLLPGTQNVFFHKRTFHSTCATRETKWNWFWSKKDTTKEAEIVEKKESEEEQPVMQAKPDGPVQIELEGEEVPTPVLKGSRWAPILELPIETIDGREGHLGLVRLNPNLFLENIRTDILNRVVVWQLAARRAGLHKTKSRGEVRGGGRKPYPQKGTGRARVGSTRSPSRVGGGHAHPIRPRSYYYPLQERVREMGLRVALSVKYAQGKVRIIKNTEIARPKTKVLVAELKKKGWTNTFFVDGKAIREDFKRASDNIPWAKVESQSNINVYDILCHDQLVLTLEALEYLEKTLVRSSKQFYSFPLLEVNGNNGSSDNSANSDQGPPQLEQQQQQQL